LRILATRQQQQEQGIFMGDRRRKIDPNGAHVLQKPAKKGGREFRTVRNICVYCGSNSGTNPAYTEAARTLGRGMAKAGVGLVYGGGGLGLMGELARTVLASGGRVTGIIPAFLSKKERMLREAHEMIVVDDMHQRKKLMFDKSDAFVALPGGIGTLEELVEQLTWAQLGRHTKPVVLVNVEGFWEPLLDLLAHMRSQEFIRQTMEVRYTTVSRAEDVLDAVRAHADMVRPEGDTTVTEKL
jgi:uncharacterized protein (TIGR00730 family)